MFWESSSRMNGTVATLEHPVMAGLFYFESWVRQKHSELWKMAHVQGSRCPLDIKLFLSIQTIKHSTLPYLSLDMYNRF